MNPISNRTGADQQQAAHSVFNAIAHWVNKYREAVSTRSEFKNCRPDEVATIARDVGLSPEELLYITKKGPHAADELARLLRALGVDPQKFRSTDPTLMRSLERVCVSCEHKDQCRHNLSAGTAAGHYQYYCPNAISLKALFK
jgi:hypothetical protein